MSKHEPRTPEEAVALALVGQNRWAQLTDFDRDRALREAGVAISAYLQFTSKRQRFIVIGDLRIDCDERIAHYAGKRIVLKNREFDVLRVLALRPDTICESDSLAREIWGNRYASTVQCLRVYISYLREKFPGLIETLPRRGYILRTGEGSAA